LASQLEELANQPNGKAKLKKLIEGVAKFMYFRSWSNVNSFDDESLLNWLLQNYPNCKPLIQLVEQARRGNPLPLQKASQPQAEAQAKAQPQLLPQQQQQDQVVNRVS
jgi:hypothetical protein